MPKIKLNKTGKTFDIKEGVNLMQSLLQNQVPVASSCHGEGVCAKCAIKIIDGESNLSRPNETETHLRDKFNLGKHMRISCQTVVLGDITIDTNYW